MKDDGCALIDIYQPLYWKKVSGQENALKFSYAKI